MMGNTYVAIDLKSFYASVECVERGLDPLTTNLVVADSGRTEKTICLAVSPSLKAQGVPSRPRLFEVISKVEQINSARRWSAPRRKLIGGTSNDILLRRDPTLALDYIIAPPRMALYMEYSTKIYGVYLKYFAPEDIHVYSIDEVFIDVTHYLRTYKMTPREIAERVVTDVFLTTGITATAGIGTNLYLAKVAMDIVAKHMSPNKNGARIAELSEATYRELLWEHKPLTDFWRIGEGYTKKLNGRGMFTMGDVALMSLINEELLYKMFGVNAELLIDHAWGWEPCEMKDIKEYKPSSKSISTGQVLSCPYENEKARLVAREMCDGLVLDLVDRGIVTSQLVLTVGYDAENLKNGAGGYSGEILLDHYGRPVPKYAHGTVNLAEHTSSGAVIVKALIELFDRITDKSLTVRRINICAANLLDHSMRRCKSENMQLDIFSDYEETVRIEREKERAYEREMRAQLAVIEIKKKHGKNAILKGFNFEDGATAIDRNLQIGGHKA